VPCGNIQLGLWQVHPTKPCGCGTSTPQGKGLLLSVWCHAIVGCHTAIRCGRPTVLALASGVLALGVKVSHLRASLQSASAGRSCSDHRPRTQGLNMHTSATQKDAPSWPAASELGRSSGSIAR
jgi:hypothetical protein